MMAKIKKDQISFNSSYTTLKDISETLRTQEDPDIDALIDMIKKASNAYDNCKTRLADVKKVLNEHMPEELNKT